MSYGVVKLFSNISIQFMVLLIIFRVTYTSIFDDFAENRHKTGHFYPQTSRTQLQKAGGSCIFLSYGVIKVIFPCLLKWAPKKSPRFYK